MTWLEIRPQDVWLFRDGKPFAAGEDHSARSTFPPSPLTVQGALRQKISTSLKVSLREYKAGDTENAIKVIQHIGRHGELNQLGRFSQRGPFISLRTTERVVPLLPVPADLLKHDKKDKFYISKPGQTLHSDLNDGFQFPQVVENYENLPSYWMTDDCFNQYLDNKVPDHHVFSGDSTESNDGDRQDALSAYQQGKRIFHPKFIYQNDDRFGVSTNALTSFREEGQLYQVQFVRPQPGIGLLVDISDAIPMNLLEGAMNIGGEQRQATATIIKNISMPFRTMVTKRFKVIFLTPAYFDAGWQPLNGDWSSVFGHSVTLKSAVVYRPLKIGGWSNDKGSARPMHNYVAPGSVYYFETDEPFSTPYALTHHVNDMNMQALGFGQYTIGDW